MPEIIEIVGSDDEFQDAVCDAPIIDSSSKTETTKIATTLSSAQSPSTTVQNTTIDDIIDKQAALNLSDDEDKDEASFVDAKEKDEKPDDEQPEYLDEFIDEEALKEQQATMSSEQLEENKEKANKMKLEANELFKNDKATEAVDMYTEALKICPISNSKERAVLYGNRAAAKIKLESKKSAIQDCTKAIELWPEYVRALIRRAKLYENEDKLDEALADYKSAYELDPGQHEAREALVRLPPIIDERNERLKEEMMGKLKDLGNLILKPFGLSTSNFQMQKDPSSGSYSINFNQNSS